MQFNFSNTIAVLAIGLVLLVFMPLTGCQCKDNASQSKITAEMALEGVSNYCHSAYDWSAAEENPDIMGLEMGEETDSALPLRASKNFLLLRNLLKQLN